MEEEYLILRNGDIIQEGDELATIPFGEFKKIQKTEYGRKVFSFLMRYRRKITVDIIDLY